MKNRSLKLSAMGGVLAAAALVSGNANAICSQSNMQVERIISYNTYGYIYMRPAGALTNSSYYYMRTTSDQVMSIAANAHTDGSRVTVSGDTASCPTTGTARYMGNSRYIYLVE